MDLKLVREIITSLETGGPFALVATLATRGSSPRRAGAWMVVQDDGTIQGTVGGGPLEARAIAAARDALRWGQSRLLEFVLTDADTSGLGMICGGEGVMLVQALTPRQVGTAAQVFTAVAALLEAGSPGWLVTESSESGAAPPEPLPPGQTLVDVCRAVIDGSGALTGDPILSDEAARHLAASGDLDSLQDESRPRLYIEPLGAPETAYIFGAGHCGQALAPLLKMIGLRVVVVDDREEFANVERFADADALILPAAFDVALDGLPIDGRSYVVIMTRCHAIDRNVLAQALRTDACYIGMIGSNRKIARIFATLRGQGFPDADLGRVYAPIGLEIGAETPEEIAVSIAAQIVQIRRGLSP